MLIEGLTLKEYVQLRKAVEKELSYHEDNAWRYVNSGRYDHYPYQSALDSLRGLAEKMGIRKGEYI